MIWSFHWDWAENWLIKKTLLILFSKSLVISIWCTMQNQINWILLCKLPTTTETNQMKSLFPLHFYWTGWVKNKTLQFILKNIKDRTKLKEKMYLNKQEIILDRQIIVYILNIIIIYFQVCDWKQTKSVRWAEPLKIRIYILFLGYFLTSTTLKRT